MPIRVKVIFTHLFHVMGCLNQVDIKRRSPTWYTAAVPYPVRPARPWPYLDFEKEKAGGGSGGAPVQCVLLPPFCEGGAVFLTSII